VAFEPLTPDRRRAMTRQYLLDAAAIVFAENGFHGSTLDAVAATAGFTKGAVYSNFKNKDDLFLALLDERLERQFALTYEVMEEDDQDVPERMPRIRALMRGGAFFSDDTWTALYLEFVLYARRNPEAREKLVASEQRTRAIVTEMIEHEFAKAGKTPPYPAQNLADVSLALFNGLFLDRLVDPSFADPDTIDTALAVLSSTMDFTPAADAGDAEP
jgi:AcrR family transcriptional regulator